MSNKELQEKSLYERRREELERKYEELKKFEDNIKREELNAAKAVGEVIIDFKITAENRDVFLEIFEQAGEYAKSAMAKSIIADRLKELQDFNKQNQGDKPLSQSNAKPNPSAQDSELKDAKGEV